MTEKEYMQKFNEMIQLYKQIKELSVEFNRAGYNFPIGMTVSAYGKTEIHLSGIEEKLPPLDFKKDDEKAPDGYDYYSVEYQGVTLFYIVLKDDQPADD